MPYTVRVSTQQGDITWLFGKAMEAVAKAIELLGCGVKEITIEGPGGPYYREDGIAELRAFAEVTDVGRT